MNPSPRLSIIVPAFNAQATIERSIRSVLAWDGDDMELIVVDDGSTDGTAELLDEIAKKESRIRVIHKTNTGRSAARNVGIAVSRAEWIMFLDADDYLFESSLQAVRSALISDAGLVVFPVIRSDRDGRVGYSEILWDYNSCLIEDDLISAVVVRDYMVDCSRVGEEYRFRLSLVDSNAVWSRLYKRSLILQVRERLGHGPFPDGVRFSEDRVFNLAYLDLMGERDILFSGWPLYFWDLSESNTVSKADPEDILSFTCFMHAVNELVACGLLPSCDRTVVATEELRSCFWRVERLHASDLDYAVSLWNRVVADLDVKEIIALYRIHSFKDAIHFTPPYGRSNLGRRGPRYIICGCIAM